MWEGDKEAILRAGIAAEHVNTDLSEPLKKKPLALSRNKGYTETACIFCPAINVCFVLFKALEC